MRGKSQEPTDCRKIMYKCSNQMEVAFLFYFIVPCTNGWKFSMHFIYYILFVHNLQSWKMGGPQQLEKLQPGQLVWNEIANVKFQVEQILGGSKNSLN